MAPSAAVASHHLSLSASLSKSADFRLRSSRAACLLRGAAERLQTSGASAWQAPLAPRARGPGYPQKGDTCLLSPHQSPLAPVGPYAAGRCRPTRLRAPDRPFAVASAAASPGPCSSIFRRFSSSFASSPRASPSVPRAFSRAVPAGQGVWRSASPAPPASTALSRATGSLLLPSCSLPREFSSSSSSRAASPPETEADARVTDGEGERLLPWRTTARRLFDFTLSPADRARLGAIHQELMACPLVRAQISEETRLACFHPLPETPLWRAALNKLSDTLFYNDTIRHRGRMLLSTVLPLYADRGLMKTYFGIAENDLCGQLYFLVLHVWLLHRRLVALQDELTRDSLWEAVDDVYRAILCEEKVSEMRISSYVREMQRTALGFCLALDEAFDEACFAGEAAHRIWYVVYGADDASRYAPHVLDLTAYLLRTSQFVADIPVDLLYRGSFSWPRWPPHIEGLSALEPTEAGEQKTFFKKM